MFLAALWLLAATAGCAEPAPPPSPVTLRVITVPAASRLAAQVGDAYVARRSHVRLEQSEHIRSGALAAVVAGQADIALIEHTLDPAELLNPVTGRRQLWSWPLARDGIAIIVHSSNPLASLTLDQLQQAFSGTDADWRALGGAEGPIQVITREPGAVARTVFDEKVLRGQRIAPAAIVLPNDRAVAEHVARTPGAIGYISMGALPEGVKVLGLNDVLPLPAEVAAGRYPLSHPVVLVARSPLSTRAWGLVSFMLSAEGQKALNELYAPVEKLSTDS